MNKHLLTIILITIALILSACVEKPTPTPEPTAVPPTDTAVPPPVTWLLECKVDKCPVMIETGLNDSGAPIITLNSGTYFVLGDRVQFYYPCVEADGSVVYCEIYRDADGNIYPDGRYIKRDKLAKVW